MHQVLRLPPRRIARILRASTALLLLLSFVPGSGAAARGEEEPPPEEPRTGSQLVAGRWLAKIDGLADDHEPVLISLAVEGDLLIGTLTVGRTTVPIHSGRIVGSQFRFSFRHADGATFVLKGAPGPRGLEGSWRGERGEGRWTARPLKG